MAYAGNYLIRSVLYNNTYLSIPAVTNGAFAPVVGRVFDEKLDPTGPTKWTIVDGGSNTYSVQYPGRKPITFDPSAKDLRVYFLADVRTTYFTIRSDREGGVFFNIVNENLFWALDDDGSGDPVSGTPVTLESLNWITGQHWSLEALD